RAVRVAAAQLALVSCDENHVTRATRLAGLQDRRSRGRAAAFPAVTGARLARGVARGTMSGGRRKEEPSPHPHSQQQQQHLVANGGGGVLRASLWSKALRSDSAWEDKDEFLDVIYWFRQIIAVILGVIWGIVPLKGFVGIAIFCLINAGVLYLYFSSFQQIDEEEYGGTWELTKEGFMTSFALFLGQQESSLEPTEISNVAAYQSSVWLGIQVNNVAYAEFVLHKAT
ncbi:putative Chromosome 20 orf 24 protein, partial [Naja naja]